MTGASSFVGSHVVDELLDKGYYVKAWAWVWCCSERPICWLSFDSAARGKKAEALRVLFADTGSHSIEIVEISDIVHSQFKEALVGVDTVIHVASPLPGRASPQEMLNVCGFWLTFPTGDYLPIPDYVDFRDVARAHVGALNSKPDKNNRERILFLSPHVTETTNKHVLDIIKKEHPELERRLISSPVPEFPDYKLVADYERIKEVTGIRKENFHTLEEVCCIWLFHHAWAWLIPFRPF